ncbi:M48 family metalloprotease [Candidatus Solirubrobacter pratensis]|uniref:M48 family metalloprotease n=1 Tax=Candidatus Solirubrobacter pratensis TaxID=1298857 RepID=UPI00040FED0B|nr:M48 family metalloprotease [Candidatus Solirubrobacter pratensis]
MTRRKLLPADRGLVARMVVAAVATPLIVLALLTVVFLAAPTKIIIVTGIASVLGVGAMRKERAGGRRTSTVSEGEAPELHAIVERLCLLADLPKPAIVVEPQRVPNSWVVGTGAGGYRLHLTEGLIDRLDRHELEAVIGHELAHVANHDAAVMTVVGGPGAALLGGGVQLMRGGWWLAISGGAVAAAIGWVASLGTRALSRYREFAADAGSVALTGSAAALASALMKVSDGISAIPARDLRAAAAQDAFHLLPVARRGEDRMRLPATHPSLEARIARLERLEQALQQRR